MIVNQLVLAPQFTEETAYRGLEERVVDIVEINLKSKKITIVFVFYHRC